MTPEDLVLFMAKACYFAQEHIDDPQVWSIEEIDREEMLQCVSYQMACFLAQNTVDGYKGVEWSVVIDDLIAHPMKTMEQWVEILNARAKELGGWKTVASTESQASELDKVKRLLRRAYDHLEYCGFGDQWERECSEELQNELSEYFCE